MPNKRYLGDGAYVSYDGFNIILTAENGIEVTNEVYLEPLVFRELLQFAKDVNLENAQAFVKEHPVPVANMDGPDPCEGGVCITGAGDNMDFSPCEKHSRT